MIYQVGSSTIGRAIGKIRPLLAERGFAVPGRPGLRLRTLEDVFTYAAAENVTLRIDGMEAQVRRPKAGRPGRRAFISGKRRRNTIKTTTINEGHGPHSVVRSHPAGPDARPDRDAQRGHRRVVPSVPHREGEVDDGYRGLANEFPDQVSAPPKKPNHLDQDDAPLTEKCGWRETKRRQSSRRICVQHAYAEHRQWRPSSATQGAARPTAKPTAPSLA
ncbi:hypothetical protein ABT272_41320 [Streptomyces sp900105245]|uniref:Transposase n=1 Tax=Streptomyces sp. 900105245 TaxID=3154379 RepID=A0ABV1UK14_9ACTN